MTFLLNFVAKPTIILMSAALLALLLRRSSASMRHAVWILAMAGALVLPVAAIVIPPIEIQVSPHTSTNVTFLPVEHSQAGVLEGERGLKPSTTYLPEISGRQLPFLWIGGMSVLLLRLFKGTVAVRRMAKTATPASDDDWKKVTSGLCVTLGIRRDVRLLFTERHVSPMTWGVLRHTVVLPSSAAQWPEERRRLVIAHELTHVKRHDGLLQIFVQIVCAIYWFNPLVWYAAHRLRIERERACDDKVLSLGTAAADYAGHLVQIARGLRVERSLSFAAISMAQPSQLETRVVSILDSRARRTPSRLAMILTGAFAGLMTVSIAAIGIAAAIPLPPVIVSAIKPVPQPPAAQPAAAPQRTQMGNATVPNSGLIPPRVVSSKPPIYTPEAVGARIEGIVTLEAAVDVNGNIKILRVLKELGYGLDQRAIGSVLDWKFAPATRNGVPVESITQIDVDFKIPESALKEPTQFIRYTVGSPGRAVWGVQSSGGTVIATTIRHFGDVTPPMIISRVEPKYTEEARAVRYQGTVLLSVTVGADGTVTVDGVVRGLDFGLTESAIEALKQWKFQPGTRNGETVPVTMGVEVNFVLK